MSTFKINVSGAWEPAMRYRAVAKLLPRATAGIAERHAEMLHEGIRERAPYRTGAYRDSWVVTNNEDGSYSVSTDHPAARRLEYGFAGRDSLGRVYNQAPQPHVLPATLEMEESYRREMRSAVKRAFLEVFKK